MWLLRRKPGVSFDQFRDHYENSHAVLGQRYLGHLLLAYRRNYVLPVSTTTASALLASALLDRVFAAKAWDYDCITEWDLADEAALAGVLETLANPVIGQIFHDDEEHFLDRASVRLIRCDRRDSDTASCAAPPLVPEQQAREGAEGAANLWNL